MGMGLEDARRGEWVVGSEFVRVRRCLDRVVVMLGILEFLDCLRAERGVKDSTVRWAVSSLD